MARADTFRSQGRGNRLCDWQQQPQVFRYWPRPDTHTALVRAIIHHSRGSYLVWFRCLHCMAFLFVRTLHLPARTLPLFLCLPVCLCWLTPRACESVWCLRGSLVRKCPAFVCACLPCASTNQQHAQSQRKGAQSPRAK